MPFYMMLSKLPVLIILLCSLLACKETSKQPNNLNTVDTTKIDTNKKIIIDSTTSIKNADNSTFSESVEDKIIDTIFKLKEVIKWSKYLEKQTIGKRHAKLWFADKPKLSDKKYYWVKVGEDNRTNYVSEFNFYVYPDSMRIMYYDTPNDIELTLDEWRKTQNGM